MNQLNCQLKRIIDRLCGRFGKLDQLLESKAINLICKKKKSKFHQKLSLDNN